MSTSFLSRFLTAGNVLSSVKNGSLETLHTTMEGLLRLMRIMSVSCCTAVRSNSSMSCALTGYALAVQLPSTLGPAVAQKAVSDQKSIPSWSQALAKAGAWG